MLIILATELKEVLVREGELIWPSADLLFQLSIAIYLRVPREGKPIGDICI